MIQINYTAEFVARGAASFSTQYYTMYTAVASARGVVIFG